MAQACANASRKKSTKWYEELEKTTSELDFSLTMALNHGDKWFNVRRQTWAF
ncbi:hypothetical protein ALT721_2180006 [Alteromonas alvinellae]